MLSGVAGRSLVLPPMPIDKVFVLLIFLFCCSYFKQLCNFIVALQLNARFNKKCKAMIKDVQNEAYGNT